MTFEDLTNAELIVEARKHGSGPGIDELCKRLERATKSQEKALTCDYCWRLKRVDGKCVCYEYWRGQRISAKAGES